MRSTWRRAVGAWLLAATWAAPAAEASPGAVHLIYMRGTGAERCPSQEELQQGIIARLGRDPFWGQGARPIWVTISRSGTQLVATIAAHAEDAGPAQVRAVTSRRHECAELASAVELALAIAIDPDAAIGRPAAPASGAAEALEEPERRPATPAAPTPQPELPDLATSPRAATPPRADGSSGRWFASAGLIVSAGAGPATSAGLALDAGVRRRAWSLAIEGRADYPNEVTAKGGMVAAAPILGAAVPCYHVRWFAGCALAAAGALRGSARDLPGARGQVTPYLAAGARLAAELAVSARFALGLHLDVLGTLTPTHLWAAETEVWHTPPLSGTLGLSVVEHFQ